MKKTIHANGTTMAYQIDGPETAPVVVMSNSLMSSLEMWDDTCDLLGSWVQDLMLFNKILVHNPERLYDF